MRPENPAPLAELIANSVSVFTKLQELSSMIRVNEPAVLFLFVIVRGIAVGVGV